MKPPKKRFSVLFEKIETLLTQSQQQENPALWLFLNDLRTPMFHLEGLARIYAKLHNKKTFGKILVQSKAIEDALGQVDYYVAFLKQFEKDTTIPASVVEFCKTKTQISIKALEELLNEENWLNGKRLAKMKKRMEDINWLKPKKEAKAISEFYKKEIGKIQEFITITKFDDIEADVHELRRKLRWLSIYARVLQGGISLQTTEKVEPHLKKYLIEAVLNSPFNKLAETPKGVDAISLSKENFMALSWVIKELGELKDKGLGIQTVKDALQETELLNDKAALEKTMQILGSKQPTIEKLLADAEKTTRQMTKDSILDNLHINL